MSTAEGTAGADASDGHDPYSYTKRDEFTSELHKIEIGNLPKMFGHGVSWRGNTVRLRGWKR